MNRSKVEALFPKLDPGINGSGDLELNLGWRRSGWSKKHWATVGEQEGARIVFKGYWRAMTNRPSHELILATGRVEPIYWQPPSFDSDDAASIGEGADWKMRIQRGEYDGHLTICDGRRLTFQQKGARASLRFEHEVAAQHAPAWRDEDLRRGIHARTGASERFTREEALMIGALLLVTDRPNVRPERRKTWW